MIVVADTSPIIFLGRLGQLPLLHDLFPSEIIVPLQVRNELLHPDTHGDESFVLLKFLEKCTVPPVSRARTFATALSGADNAVLTLAIRKKASVVLADERLLRRIALSEGINVMGTIGILRTAMDRKLISPEQARTFLRSLVRNCGFRISIEVFERAMEAFDDPR